MTSTASSASPVATLRVDDHPDDLRPVPAATPRALAPADLARVDAALRDHVAHGSDVLSAVGADLTDVVARVHSLLSGGKRLRAAFCLWGARGALAEGAEVPDHVVDAAAALELFHLAALVHDDVMDRSDLRRGAPTVHRSFRRMHRDTELRGDAELFGNNAAVLVGDLGITWSDDLLHGAVAAAGPHGTAARAVWDQMRTEVLAGQYLDLLAHARPATSTGAAEQVMRYKSSSYTVQHPLVLGGCLAGADAGLLTTYAELGLLVGEAFQLRDDVLGVVGDPELTGKPNGDDVREGKRTVLVAEAEEHADRAQRAVLDRHLGDPDLSPEGLAAVRRVLVATGALERVEQRIAADAARAHDLLAEATLPAAARDALGGLIDACAWRQT